MANSWRVFKFGGSSVADAACMRRVADIIEGEPAGPLAVVLSACKGVTDRLLDLVSAAERQEPTAPTLAALRQQHLDIASEICTPADRRRVRQGA
jgi:aspartokinase